MHNFSLVTRMGEEGKDSNGHTHCGDNCLTFLSLWRDFFLLLVRSPGQKGRGNLSHRTQKAKKLIEISYCITFRFWLEILFTKIVKIVTPLPQQGNRSYRKRYF